MISKTILARVLVVITVLAGCASTSGGGSQTNWDTCKTNGDCATGDCVHGICRNPRDSRDSGTAGATGSKDSGAAGATGSKDSGAAGATGSKDSGTADATATGFSSSGELGPWALTADYPLASTCVASSEYVYCVGGESTSTYYSKLSSTKVGPWIRGANYPVPIKRASCVVSSNYVYCVGGYGGGPNGGADNPTADVYYAPLLSPGIGTWTASTPFPHVTSAPQCMADSGYIYCVSRSPDAATTPDAYFAPISSNGVGAWTPTAAPATGTVGCASVGGFAYCFGGGNCAPAGPASDCYSPSYFAPLSASGIGTWRATTELPTAGSATYATAGSYVYYLSIPVFFATVSADGIGPWKTTTNYPDSTNAAICFSNGGYLYCAGPSTNGSVVAQIGAPNPQAFQLENPPPFPRSEYLVPAWNNGGGCSVSSNGVSAGAPCFGQNIDNAVVFNCASQASTPAGCTTTVVSSNTAYNYDVTVWYPCTSNTGTDTNCCFLPSVGYDTPFNDWCISIGSNAFIVAGQITMRQSQ